MSQNRWTPQLLENRAQGKKIRPPPPPSFNYFRKPPTCLYLSNSSLSTRTEENSEANKGNLCSSWSLQSQVGQIALIVPWTTRVGHLTISPPSQLKEQAGEGQFHFRQKQQDICRDTNSPPPAIHWPKSPLTNCSCCFRFYLSFIWICTVSLI